MRPLRWLHENGEKVLLAIFALIAAAAAILALSTEWLGASDYLGKRVPAGILLLLATFVLVFVSGYQTHVEKMTAIVAECKRIMDQSMIGMVEHVRKFRHFGIEQAYNGRDDPGQKDAYVNLLKGGNSKILIVGVTLKEVPQDHRPILLEKCTHGCSVQLLMLTPERWPNLHPVLDPIEPGDLKHHFTHALVNIRSLAVQIARQNQIRNSKGRRARNGNPCFEVRFYDQAPSVSLTVADADAPSGRMRVEFTPHNETNVSYFRPMLDLVPSEGGWFNQFCLHYEGLWNKSKSYLRVTNSKISRSQTFDDSVASSLGLSRDWVPPEFLGEDLD